MSLSKDEVNKLIRELLSYLPKKVSATDIITKEGDICRSKLPFKVLSIREILIHRMADFCSSVMDLISAGKITPAYTLMRSSMETTALLFTLNKKIIQAIETKNIGDFDDFLMKSLFGSKKDNASPQAINALTWIDKYVDKKIKGFSDLYRSLCDIAHPNHAGGMATYANLDRENHTLFLGNYSNETYKALGLAPLSISLLLFKNLYNEIGDKFPDFIELCEANLNK